MAVSLPTTKTVTLSLDRGRLDITLNRPEVRNAMSLAMVGELEAVFDAIVDAREVRVVVLRGAGGHFCAGGDIKDMAAARSVLAGDGADALATTNRRFGHLITKVNRAPAAVVGVLEGAVMGGGFGLACVVDVAIAAMDAVFRLPETGLGIPPAQIAPFLVQRLGASEARRLAVTGARLDGAGALAIGLVHEVVEPGELDDAVARTVAKILRCAPGAVAATKRLMLDSGRVPQEELLDRGAAAFAEAARGPEGVEGMTAFVQKRAPCWVPEGDA